MPPEIPILQSPITVSQGYVELSHPDPAFVSLRAGNKILHLDICKPDTTQDRAMYAGTNISNLPNEAPLPGATTALYGRVKEILQGLADESQQHVRYKLVTSNPNMLAWAMDPEKGVTIFDWENVALSGSGKVTFTKDIKPNSVDLGC